ncbi:hypothetical protein RR42_s1199 [Cupriavidus basilensis]|uniref:Uncharacterized protein n=1 Tax=Cupriavidus basilensis TaxID=68895 RepID=A0A0C4YB61_9BURK|nr:hypothetical protein RR42_s1199 [Cupriavidus basilensis]
MASALAANHPVDLIVRRHHGARQVAQRAQHRSGPYPLRGGRSHLRASQAWTSA